MVVAFDVYSKASAKERADTEQELLHLAGIGHDGGGGGSGGDVSGSGQEGSGGRSRSVDGDAAAGKTAINDRPSGGGLEDSEKTGGGDSPLAKVNSRSSGRQPMDDRTKVG